MKCNNAALYFPAKIGEGCAHPVVLIDKRDHRRRFVKRKDLVGPFYLVARAKAGVTLKRRGAGYILLGKELHNEVVKRLAALYLLKIYEYLGL